MLTRMIPIVLLLSNSLCPGAVKVGPAVVADSLIPVLMIAEGVRAEGNMMIAVDPSRSLGVGELKYVVAFGDGSGTFSGVLAPGKAEQARPDIIIKHAYERDGEYNVMLRLVDETERSCSLITRVSVPSVVSDSPRIRMVSVIGDKTSESIWEQVYPSSEIDVLEKTVTVTRDSSSSHARTNKGAEVQKSIESQKKQEKLIEDDVLGHRFCPWFYPRQVDYPKGAGDYYMDLDPQWSQLGWNRDQTLELDAAHCYDDNESGAGGWTANWHMWIIPFEGRWKNSITIPTGGQFSFEKAISKGWIPPSSRDLRLRGPYWSGERNEWGDTGEIGPHGVIYWSFYIWDWLHWGMGTATDIAIYLWEGDECWGPFCNPDDPIALFQVNRLVSYGTYVFVDDSPVPPWGLLNNWDGHDIWLQLHTVKK